MGLLVFMLGSEGTKAVGRGDTATMDLFGGGDPTHGGKLHAEKRTDKAGHAATHYVLGTQAPGGRSLEPGGATAPPPAPKPNIGAVAQTVHGLTGGPKPATPPPAPAAAPPKAPIKVDRAAPNAHDYLTNEMRDPEHGPHVKDALYSFWGARHKEAGTDPSTLKRLPWEQQQALFAEFRRKHLDSDESHSGPYNDGKTGWDSTDPRASGARVVGHFLKSRFDSDTPREPGPAESRPAQAAPAPASAASKLARKSTEDTAVTDPRRNVRDDALAANARHHDLRIDHEGKAKTARAAGHDDVAQAHDDAAVAHDHASSQHGRLARDGDDYKERATKASAAAENASQEAMIKAASAAGTATKAPKRKTDGGHVQAYMHEVVSPHAQGEAYPAYADLHRGDRLLHQHFDGVNDFRKPTNADDADAMADTLEEHWRGERDRASDEEDRESKVWHGRTGQALQAHAATMRKHAADLRAPSMPKSQRASPRRSAS